MTHCLQELDDFELERLAGPAALERGVGYFLERRVRHLHTNPRGLNAEVAGSRRYQLWIHEEDDRLDWFCDCPAAEDGAFCKHLVAAVLTLRDDQSPSADTADNALLEALSECAPTQLAEWLLEAAQRDPELEQRLRLRLSASTPKSLEARLDDLLTPTGDLDYQGSLDYGEQLAMVADLLADHGHQDPNAGFLLCEQAVARGLAYYAHSDDSAGTIGDHLHELAVLHAEMAGRAASIGEDFPDRLFRLKTHDEWALFPLSAYWPRFDAAARERYAALVLDRFRAIGRHPKTETDAFSIRHLREELAEEQGDTDTLIELLKPGLPGFYAYQKLIDVCQRHGHIDDALTWAEQGVQAHPDHPALHRALAGLYRQRNRINDAIETLWQGFQYRVDLQLWDDLLDLAGPDEAIWYQKARAALLARAPQMESYEHAQLIAFFIHNNDPTAALPIAKAHPIDLNTLLHLADVVRADHPHQAAKLIKKATEHQLRDAVSQRYPFAVRLMKRVRRYAPTPDTDAWIADLRQRFARRPALMRRMDDAGL